MKKKLFVALIAIVVVAAIVGSAYAVYAKDAAPRTVVLSTGDAVTLGITATDNFDLSLLNPNDSKTLPVVLTATNVNMAEAGIQGEFKVTIAAKTESDADKALAAAINVTASGTHNDNSAYAADKATLTSGDLIDLTNIPTTMTLTFSISEEDFFGGAAEGQVAVTLSWIIVDNWEANTNDYYVVGTMTGWQITKDSLVLSTDKQITGDDNFAALLNVHFNEGDEFKVHKWWNDDVNDWHKYALQGESTNVTFGEYNNVHIGETGYYNIYINKNSQLWVSFVGTTLD